MQDIYEKVFERLLSEFSTMGGVGGAPGNVTGVSTPIGTGPKAGSRGEDIYKKSTATDEKHRSKGKKKKTHTKSIQYYLKHGGEKGRKRSFKKSSNIFESNLLLERTDRLYNLSPQEVLNFLGHLKGDILKDVSFDISEKISGQNTTIGIKGTASGNEYYFALKSQLGKDDDIFDYQFKTRGAAASRRFKYYFKETYDRVRQLSPGEEIVLGVEIVKGDKSKPDYIAYGVPSRQTQVAVFMGDFTKEDAKAMTGSGIVFLTSDDIKKSPAGKEKLSKEVADSLDILYNKVKESLSLNLNKQDFKDFINNEILPDFRKNITALFGTSSLNTLSPIEGIAVNMSSGDDSRFFKVHSEEFENIQQAQTYLYSEFKEPRNASQEKNISNKEFLSYKDKFGNYIRAGLLYDYVNNIGRQRKYKSLGFLIFSFIRQVSEMTHFENTRVFFSPEEFKLLCSKLLNAVKSNHPADYIDVIKFLGSSIPKQEKLIKNYRGKDRHGKPKFKTRIETEFVWHTITGNENYDCPEADQIKNLNFDI